jgi:hypothetical protein
MLKVGNNMIPIAKLFLISEIGPILGPPFRNSIGSTSGPAVQTGNSKPVGKTVAEINANKQNIVRPLPKDNLGMKPFRKLP